MLAALVEGDHRLLEVFGRRQQLLGGSRFLLMSWMTPMTSSSAEIMGIVSIDSGAIADALVEAAIEPEGLAGAIS